MPTPNAPAVSPAPVSTGLPTTLFATEDTVSLLNLGTLSISDSALANSAISVVRISVSTGTLAVQLDPPSGAPTAGGGAIAVADDGSDTVTLTGTLGEISTFLSANGSVSYTGGTDVFGTSADTFRLAVFEATDFVPLATAAINISDVVDVLNGTTSHDTLTGDDGMNDLIGRAGNDRLLGRGGSDTLTGNEGADHLDGGAGGDVMNGGTGNDNYVVDNGEDVVIESVGYAQGGGLDTVYTSIDYTLGTNTEVLRMMGDLELYGSGNDGHNILVGNDGANILYGMGGNDRIVGHGGQDVLFGNAGADILNGGAGVDLFVFTSIADSRAGVGNRDTINGFLNLREQIDLSAIDANTYNGAATNDTWDFIGSRAFDGTWGDSAGQLRTQGLGAGVNAVLVEGDHNGDGIADFQILINGTSWMTGSDFAL